MDLNLLKLPKDLSKPVMTNLIQAYKEGVVIIERANPNSKEQNTLKNLSQAGCIDLDYIETSEAICQSYSNQYHTWYYFDDDSMSDKYVHVIFSLTKLGAKFVESSALSFLEEESPFYTYPLINQFDLIRVTTDSIAQCSSVGRAVTLQSFAPGVYTVGSINKESVVLISDNPRWGVGDRRVQLQPNVGVLKFASKIPHTVREFNRRMGRIKLSSLISESTRTINPLIIAEKIETLREKPYIRKRLDE